MEEAGFTGVHHWCIGCNFLAIKPCPMDLIMVFEEPETFKKRSTIVIQFHG